MMIWQAIIVSQFDFHYRQNKEFEGINSRDAMGELIYTYKLTII
jgi:hypothetical protein